jgi:hypothetical protein
MKDCMESFNVRINQSTVFDDTNGGVNTWGTVGQYYWTSINYPSSQFSTYTLQGFKNINIYGVSVNGFVIGDPSGIASKSVVLDWSFMLRINGTPSLTSGITDTVANGWNIKTLPPDINQFSLSKNTPSLMLANPIQSATSINFNFLLGQGIAATLLDTVYLYYDLYFTFYYKYEGE